MKKLLILALLAATAASPVLAQERPAGDRGFGQPRAERQNRAERQARPDRARIPEARAQRGDGQRPTMQRRGEMRPQANAPDRRWRGNGDRPANASPDTTRWQRAAPVADRQGNRDQNRNWSRARDGNGDRNWAGNRAANRDRNWNSNRDANRDRNWNGNRDANRDRNWANNRDWNRDRNWNGNRDRNWDRDDHRWNRDWRNDRRYDWQRYRQDNRHVYRSGRYHVPYGWDYGYRRFNSGIYLDSMLFGSSYWIDDPWHYRLPPANGPYRWVRYFDDVLLVDIRNGYVVDTIYDFFW
ncbi:RcnB family protein [Sphingomonas sp. C3-2]|uniref:RcnB family protein n=1 Tax=Sphingomonas sp. C3-2 TaxID=3062169 RepID=UPI00294B104C|nr:RcnB family protein [Sphingomonas sp. C3-2]WOK38105.1 RcnB family protein [Sphingomonas sp. C3-2]